MLLGVLVRQIEGVPRQLVAAAGFRLYKVGIVVSWVLSVGSRGWSRFDVRTISQRRSLETFGRFDIVSAVCRGSDVHKLRRQFRSIKCGIAVRIGQDFPSAKVLDLETLTLTIIALVP